MDDEYVASVMANSAAAWEPSEAQKRAASTSHNAIREALDSERMKMSARITGDYLSGSYARRTAIAPIDDVDIIFLIDPTEWGSSGPDDYPEPDRVLSTFARAIRVHRSASRIRIQRRSVRLSMYAMDIDAVPAIPTNRSDYIVIPDRFSDEWLLTAPKHHSTVATEVNRRRNSLFIPLVKILKGWNSTLPKTTRLKSFTIETMAVRIFRKTAFGSLFEGALLFFDFLCWQFSEPTLCEWEDDFDVRLGWADYSLPDVAETGSNLLHNLSGDRRTAFLTAALRSRTHLDAATRARSPERCADQIQKALRL